MKRSFPLLGSLVLTASYAGHAQAQYIFVGQTAGTAYVSFVPTVTLTGQAMTNMPAGGGTDQTYELDFDQDGRADLGVYAAGYIGPLGHYPSHSTYLLARHTDIEFYTADGRVGPVPVGLASGDTLQPQMHRRSAIGKPGTWANGYSTYNGTTYYDSRALSLVASGGMGAYSDGDWLDLQGHYVGFRLRANAAAPWRYGWLLAQVTSTSNPASLTIKSYALTSQPLGTRSALAAGWQIYPTQVADQLTIESPVAAAGGQLTILDLCGRRMVREVIAGHQQLSLAALAAGVYVVQLDTPAGRFAQRIVKQ